MEDYSRREVEDIFRKFGIDIRSSHISVSRYGALADATVWKPGVMTEARLSVNPIKESRSVAVEFDFPDKWGKVRIDKSSKTRWSECIAHWNELVKKNY